MSEYVTIGSIRTKNEIMLPQVLRAYREGTLDLNSFDTVSPLQQLYANTYQYANFPQIDDRQKELISLVKPTTVNLSQLQKNDSFVNKL